MGKIKILLAHLLFTIGCSSDTYNITVQSLECSSDSKYCYCANIDPEFEIYIPDFYKAFGSWQTWTKNYISFTVTLGSEVNSPINCKKFSVDLLNKDSDAVKKYDSITFTVVGYEDGKNVYIYKDVIPAQASDVKMDQHDFAYKIAMHEIGHAIGLSHLTDENAIMNPYITKNMDDYPTLADVQELCQIDGCNANSVYLGSILDAGAE